MKRRIWALIGWATLFLVGCGNKTILEDRDNKPYQSPLATESSTEFEDIEEADTEDALKEATQKEAYLPLYEVSDAQSEKYKDLYAIRASFHQVRIETDTTDKQAVGKSINEQLSPVVALSYARYEQLAMEARQELIAYDEREGTKDFRYYTYSLRTKVLRNDEQVFSLALYTKEYLGKDHDIASARCLNFDAQTGELITIETLVDTAEFPAFQEKVMEKVMEECAEKYPKVLETVDKESLRKTIFVEGKWALSADGLQFVVDPYVLADYATGMLVFTVPDEVWK